MDKRKIEYKQSEKHREEINAWLESEEREFDEGYNLFVRFSHNRALALMLARTRRHSKLVYELQKIAERAFVKDAPVMPLKKVSQTAKRHQENVEAEKLVEANTKSVVKFTVGIIPDELPEDLQKLYVANREEHKLMRAIHEKMKLAKGDNERAEFRKQLVEFDDKIAKRWATIDAWMEDGDKEPEAGSAEPEEEEEKQTGTGGDGPKPESVQMQDLKDVNAARSYLSRNLKKIADLEGDKREKLIAKLKERVAVLVAHKAEIKEETRVELVKLGLLEDNGNK